MDTRQRVVAARQRIASLDSQQTELTHRLAEIRNEVESALVEWLPTWFEACARQQVEMHPETAQTAGVHALKDLKEAIAALAPQAGSIVRDCLAEVEWPHISSTVDPAFGSWSTPQGPSAHKSRTVSNQLPPAIADAVLQMCTYVGSSLVEAGIAEPVKDEPGHGGASWRIQADGSLRFYDNSARGLTAEVPRSVERLLVDYVDTLRKLRESRQNHRQVLLDLEKAEALLRFEEA